MANNNVLQQIEERQQKLHDAGEELKSHFIGMDSTIDKITRAAEAWACLPEMISRPTIINLWGLTGTGKTDFVRRFVRALKMEDNFVEIQLTNKGSSQDVYASTLQGLLGCSNISPDRPGVLLLDEIQRFRSIDSDGKDIHDYRFQDLWMLLSDGSFGGASSNKEMLMNMLYEEMYWDDYEQATAKTREEMGDAKDKDEEEKKDDKAAIFREKRDSRRKFKQSYYTAKHLKNRLRLTEDIEEIMQWGADQKMRILKKKLEDRSIYAEEKYSKLLIFISGNLDEAYSMSGETAEIDIDADLFHKHSLRINLLTIKNALYKRFKPEQIARFGNSHIIYPALSRATYERLIERRLKEAVAVVSTQTNGSVNFEIDKTVHDAIYRNGVFPAQGTRPVFSTISSFFECVLPHFMLAALRSGVPTLKLYYEDRHLCADIGGEIFKVKNEGDVDKIKYEKRNEDKIRKVAIHEAGHCVAYAVLFNVVPTQISVNATSEDKNGFVGIHDIDSSASALKKLIQVFWAGRVAEEMIFGKENVGSGAEGDITRATSKAASYIRRLAMGDYVSRMELTTAGQGAIYSNNDTTRSNKDIEELLRELKNETESLLKSNKSLLIDLADYLVVHETMEPQPFFEICKEHGVVVKHVDAKETLYPTYRDIFEKTKKKAKDKVKAKSA